VLLCLLVFHLGLQIVGPSAIARLYIGRVAEAVFIWSVAWCVMRLVALSLNRVESRMDDARRFASRSVLHLGRRTFNTVIVIFAILMTLSNWGYNTATLVAGLGVGGIAVALAAQQTIANVFGGISVIGDHPVSIGDFGNFGGLIGTVEDIGMRSTRVRTLNRTVVSVPNSNFAGFNLENYSVRDKILFNPSFQIKRSASDDQMHALIGALEKLLASRKDVEPVPTPARIVGMAAGFYTLEIFAYVVTPDIDVHYKIQSELLLQINGLFKESNVELA
jgi:MscS family membrane protein